MSEFPYTTIHVTGDDAFEFLQAQLAADLRDLTDPKLSAWCNPKGRVICLMRVAQTAEGYALTVPTELADEVVRRLTMFRFRAKVEFTAHDANAEDLGIDSDYESWRLGNLRAGIPEILKAQSEEFTPHMLNLDLLGAVSLDKGCYPGQEIVARTHYRGATKRRCLRFESTEPVSPSDKVSDGSRDVGEVVNAIDTDLLAVVPVDKKNTKLTVNGVDLKPIPLDYL
jgi:folate-binding protein YgfZ